MQRKYPDDPTKEVFEAAKSGDAVLLSEVLQELEWNSGEIFSALETKTSISISTSKLLCAHLTPLIVSVVYGNLDCVKVLLQYQAYIDDPGNGDINLGVGSLCKWYDYCTPLFVAAAYGNLDILSCLVKNGADVNGNTYTSRNWTTPLMIASRKGLVNVVTFLIEHGAYVDLQDITGDTALHHAVNNEQDLCDVVSCLIKNGADVNAHNSDNCTPLMLASRQGHLNLVTFLLKHGADMKLQDKNGKTALHYADSRNSWCDVLSCLIDNGADVNACDFNNRTPLMIASKNGLVNVVTFLIEHGANVDLQDKEGNTALHHASCSKTKSFDVSHKLLSLGASQLCNSQGLTPLLFASNNCSISVVENLITRPEFTKEQRIDALELLGSSLATKRNNLRFSWPQHAGKGFEYIKRGMKERFADSSHPLLKKPMDLVEEFQNRKESQTLKELAQIEGDEHAILMESLIIRERILGTNNAELLGPIRKVARYYGRRLRHPICMELFRHAIKIAQSCDQSAISDLLIDATSFILEETQSYDFPREKVFFELLEQTVLEYDKQRKLRGGLDNESYKLKLSEENLEMLFYSTMDLVQRIAEPKHSNEFKTSHVSVLLKRVFCLNPRDRRGNTLLHTAVDILIEFWNDLTPNCTDTVKLLLNEGFNVNVVNNNGDTPLHRAVTFVPKNDNEMPVLTGMLEALLDGGAHHDFVNNDGQTAMDMARTDEARYILLEKRKLELKCISARAVKKYRLPYLGMVPKTVEKCISMH